MSTESTPPEQSSTPKAARSGDWLAARLIDYGDGVKGHFCIGKPIERGSIYWHFWNDDFQGGGWCSAGTVYVGQDVALAKLRKLSANTEVTDRHGGGSVR